MVEFEIKRHKKKTFLRKNCCDVFFSRSHRGIPRFYV